MIPAATRAAQPRPRPGGSADSQARAPGGRPGYTHRNGRGRVGTPPPTTRQHRTVLVLAGCVT